MAYDNWDPEKPMMDLKSLTLRTRQTRLPHEGDDALQVLTLDRDGHVMLTCFTETPYGMREYRPQTLTLAREDCETLWAALEDALPVMPEAVEFCDYDWKAALVDRDGRRTFRGGDALKDAHPRLRALDRLLRQTVGPCTFGFDAQSAARGTASEGRFLPGFRRRSGKGGMDSGWEDPEDDIWIFCDDAGRGRRKSEKELRRAALLKQARAALLAPKDTQGEDPGKENA